MRTRFQTLTALALLAAALLAQANTQWQYNLGDMPSSLMGNPAFMNQAIGNVLSGKLAEWLVSPWSPLGAFVGRWMLIDV